MKVLVTGANGYLGQGIVKQLLNDGITVVATDFSSENIDKRAEIYEGDIFKVDEPFDFFDKPDAILHLAWKNGFVHDDDSHIIDLPKHFLFLKKMVDSGIGQIAVMGTMHEVGFYEGKIDEKTPCNPENKYGIAKNALRQLLDCVCRHKGTVFQWLRGFYMVGNYGFGNSIFSKIALAEKNKTVVFPFTSGKNRYDFIDYDDFCFQVACAVEQKAVNGIINVCSGKPQTLSERVEKFIKDNGFNIKLGYGLFPDREYDSKIIFGDDTKIKLILKNRVQQIK